MTIHDVLILEDEPFLCNAYELMFKEINSQKGDHTFKIKIAKDFENGQEMIRQYEGCVNNLLALFDIRIGESSFTNSRNGAHLAGQLRQNVPNSKIIMATSLSDNFTLYSIFKLVNPQGFLVKAEMDFERFLYAIVHIIEGKFFFTETINAFLRNEAHHKLPLDDTDRRMLHFLQCGYKIREISNFLNLSISGIEWRQRRMAELFGLQNSNAKGLLEKVMHFGLV